MIPARAAASVVSRFVRSAIPRPTLFAALALSLIPLAPAAELDLFDLFASGWRDHWHEQRLFSKPTSYELVHDSGRAVLHATSHAANAALLRPLDLPLPSAARLRWRWKISSSLTANRRERERAGDDYAARVFVVFESSWIPLRTRAINYVWSAHEPAGAIFPSPYTKNVGMIILRSGNADAGRWCDEQRDVLADYQRFFGAPPTQMSAVAVLVDTDNTGLSAEAWFADLTLETTAAAKP